MVRDLRMCGEACRDVQKVQSTRGALQVSRDLGVLGTWPRSPQERQIMERSNVMFGVAAGGSLLTAAASSLLLRLGRRSALALEVLAVILVCLGMLFLPMALPFYTGRLLGHDSKLYLENRHITDSGLLLSIDAFVTASHMSLGVRFFCMLPIQVGALLCYIVPSYLLGSPEGENMIPYGVTLLSLITMAAIGKYNLEYQGISVAIKVPTTRGRTFSNKLHVAELCNELRILRKLRHPNIVFMYGACLDEQGCNVALILELVEGCSLDKFVLWGQLHPEKGDPARDVAGPPSEVDRLQVLVDVTCALRYLHSRTPHVAHGDLNDRNVFVEPRVGDRVVPRAKLLDFGLARLRTRHAPPMGGTLRWTAPEVFGRQSSAKSTSADVYSFGRLAYFVVTGLYPFHGRSKAEISRMLERSHLPPMEWPPSGPTSSTHCAILEKCCSAEPRQRPSMSRVHRDVGAWHAELLGHPSPCVEAEPLNTTLLFGGTRQNRQLGLRRPRSPELRDQGGVATGSSNAQPVSSARISSASAAKYRLTPDRTVVAMVLEVLLSCNVEIPEGSCCPFHGCVDRLLKVCADIGRRKCVQDWQGGGRVCGQCSSCGILFPEDPASSTSLQQPSAVRQCTFCNSVQNKLTCSSHLSCSTCGALSIEESFFVHAEWLKAPPERSPTDPRPPCLPHSTPRMLLPLKATP
ncbi:unnamed protein product [Prorocentrum cordatum]|uniref:Protein kinase domain-containing protein n=1 Tax=Prorocentrum cordatum TaxID=2364126 RepID=A0ABN9Y020_9DINO|nr:unnamed protein product [Polarella glacialis]